MPEEHHTDEHAQDAENVCYVHADDYESIVLAPRENYTDAVRALRLGPPSEGSPALPYTLAARDLTLADIDAALRAVLPPAGVLMTGYTTDLASVPGGFAYFDPDFGAIYGRTRHGQMEDPALHLYFDNTYCDCGIDFSDAMHAIEAFARRHGLIMVDWLMETVVDLAEAGAMARYFEGL
ncbi:MAG: hypothetical protein ACOCXZ_01585 [Chloroflexota bacterium]